MKTHFVVAAQACVSLAAISKTELAFTPIQKTEMLGEALVSYRVS
jgi:hypothetical protein